MKLHEMEKKSLDGLINRFWQKYQAKEKMTTPEEKVLAVLSRFYEDFEENNCAGLAVVISNENGFFSSTAPLDWNIPARNVVASANIKLLTLYLTEMSKCFGLSPWTFLAHLTCEMKSVNPPQNDFEANVAAQALKISGKMRA